jgi:hypothetical protein
MVLENVNACVLFVCVVSVVCVFVALICGKFQDLFFNLMVVFIFSIALSLSLPTDLI